MKQRCVAAARAARVAGRVGAIGVLAALGLWAPLPSRAAGDGDVQRMIDALKPSAGAASGAATRGGAATTGRTRNLIVEPAPAGQAAAPSTGGASTNPPVPSTTPPASPAPPAAAGPAAPAPATPAPATATPAAGSAAPGLSLAISFEPNSAQLRAESGGLIGALVAAMLSSELRSTRFIIEGHTDASGSPAQNLRLSRERAEQVRLALMTLGVAGERLSAVGKGSSEPANPRDPRSPENRRVRVVPVP